MSEALRLTTCSRCKLRPATNGGYCRECRIVYQRERRAEGKKELAYLRARNAELEAAVRVLAGLVAGQGRETAP